VKPWLKRLSFFGYLALFVASGATLVGVFLLRALLTLPDVGALSGCLTTTMYHVDLCPKSANYVKLDDISPYVLHAVIVSEDGSFYSHKGFDWHEMKESFTANLSAGGIRRGGSTLTQQLAKNVFLDKEKSIWRKLKEAYLASAIEHHFDKKTILEKYLNVVEFGPELYGIKPAAQRYFHKSPAQLHPLEAAWLAFLLPNPKGYSKSFRQQKLTPFGRRQVKVILKRMESYGKMSSAAYETAIGAVDQFPWSGLTLASFAGTPSHSLETNVPGPAVDQPVDDATLDEIIKEDDDGDAAE
jgi:monofunctional biosynthetic peptidoglycan transglycosylase